MIGQRQSHLMGAQEVQETRCDPPAIAEFDSEAVPWWELFEERFQTLQERLWRGELTFRKIGKLQQQGAQLLTQSAHDLRELLQVPRSIAQQLLVGDEFGDFGGKAEVRWGSAIPRLDHGRRRDAIKCHVDLDGRELLRVEREEIRRLGAVGIDTATPILEAPA
jgi:hypothetical protein